MQVGQLFVALGFDVDDKQLKDFNQEVKNGMTGLLKMVGVMSGAAFAVNAFVSGAVRTSVELKNFREETGYASDDVERFYNVIGRLNSNVSLEQTIGMFKTLSDVIADAKIGGKGNQLAGLLGISDLGNKTPLEVLKALRKSFKDKNFLNDDTFRIKMAELGVGSEFMTAIKATDAEFNALFNKPILGAENRKRLEDIAEAQKELSFQWQLLRGELSAEISDEMIVFMENLIPIMKDVIANFKAVGIAVQNTFKAMTGENQSLVLASMAALAAGIVVAFNPVLALFVAILAAYNDIGKAMRGEQSFVGDLANTAEDLANMIGAKLGIDMPSSASALIAPPSTDFSRMSASGQLTVNNVWNIASNGDNLTLAGMIKQEEAKTMSAVMSQQTRGVVK